MAAEQAIAGEVFRPRGAWGDDPMGLRRFAARHLGLGGLHRLERRMGILNLAVATPARLLLFRLRGTRNGIDVDDEIAAWPIPGLRIRHERRSVQARHFSAAAANTFTTSVHTSRIVVLGIDPPHEATLEIDLADSRDAAALVASLTPAAERK